MGPNFDSRSQATKKLATKPILPFHLKTKRMGLLTFHDSAVAMSQPHKEPNSGCIEVSSCCIAEHADDHGAYLDVVQ